MLHQQKVSLKLIDNVGETYKACNHMIFPTEKLYNIDMALEFKRAWLMLPVYER